MTYPAAIVHATLASLCCRTLMELQPKVAPGLAAGAHVWIKNPLVAGLKRQWYVATTNFASRSPCWCTSVMSYMRTSTQAVRGLVKYLKRFYLCTGHGLVSVPRWSNGCRLLCSSFIYARTTSEVLRFGAFRVREVTSEILPCSSKWLLCDDAGCVFCDTAWQEVLEGASEQG